MAAPPCDQLDVSQRSPREMAGTSTPSCISAGRSFAGFSTLHTRHGFLVRLHPPRGRRPRAATSTRSAVAPEAMDLNGRVQHARAAAWETYQTPGNGMVWPLGLRLQQGCAACEF